MRAFFRTRVLVLALALTGPLLAAPPAGDARASIAPGIGRKAPPGRPNVKLDRLVFPSDLARASALERHFRHMLKRAARRADWGAGKGARIEYRVQIEELAVREESGVLRVSCTALGRLPSGKTARSHIDFGGDPKQGTALVERVLDIVARAVVARLAALERTRRRAS